MTNRYRHHPGTEDAAVVRTPSFQHALTAITMVRFRCIIMLNGAPGLGKTFAADYACQQLALPIYWLDLTGVSSPTAMFQQLYEAITGHYPRWARRADLEHDCQELLDGQAAVLAIDECQWANRDLLRCTRSIYDHAPDGFRLVLVGHGAREHVEKVEPGLASRIGRLVEFVPTPAKKRRELLNSYHPLFANTEPTVLAKLNDAVGGNFRGWAEILDAALTLDPAAEALTAQDAERLLRFIGKRRNPAA